MALQYFIKSIVITMVVSIYGQAVRNTWENKQQNKYSYDSKVKYNQCKGLVWRVSIICMCVVLRVLANFCNESQTMNILQKGPWIHQIFTSYLATVLDLMHVPFVQLR